MIPQATFGVAESSRGTGETAAWSLEFRSSGRHGVEILGADNTKSSDSSTDRGSGTKKNRARTQAKSLNGKALSSNRLLCWVITVIVVIIAITTTATATAGCHCIIAIAIAVGKRHPRALRALANAHAICPSLRAFTAPKFPADPRAVTLP